MATESNSGFPLEDTMASMMNRHAISFQSAAVNSTSEMIPMGNYYGGNMMLAGNSSIVNAAPGIIQPSASSPSSLLLDSVPGLKHDAGLAVEWSLDEQYRLEEGLDKYKDEPNIMKYIKIAASLPDKTVRDVALRCRWMQRKRRKSEEHKSGKGNGRKLVPYPPVVRHHDQNGHMLSEGMSCMHLLEQNVQAFSQISSNLSTYKLQENVDLFLHARNNISTILNDMREMPGVMSQMPPLPVTINEDLANSIFPSVTNVLPTPTPSMIFGGPSGIHMKQEPRC